MKKGYGFWSKFKFYLIRCYECGKENYLPSVATGQCAWCGSTKTDKESVNERT
jgi:ribosomal protein L37E